VSDDTYIKFVNGYSISKKVGVKGVWIFICGSGVCGLCIEAVKGEVRNYGRRKLGTGILAGLAWIAGPVVPLITNSTKIIKFVNATHTSIAFIAETCEDCTNAMWIPLDLILTGQLIPAGEAGRYNLMSGDESLFNFLCD
jgi:hypothetical protein